MERELDAWIVVNLESSDMYNLMYLTGFQCSRGVGIVTQERALFLTDSRYLAAAKEQITSMNVSSLGDDTLESLVHQLEDLGAEKVGFDKDRVTVGTLEKLEAKSSEITYIGLENPIEESRKTKDYSEIDKIAGAAELTDAGYRYLLELITPGKTERELALELEIFLRKQGAENVAFDPIVASGTNSANPHAKPGEKSVENGELLLLDIGARKEGYCSDLSRTLFLGPPPDELRSIYKLLLRAQESAISIIEPGIQTQTVDEKAREMISEAGYGENFGHSLGHGVGLEIHEDPRLSQNSEETLEAGMVTTVEPGIYIPGKGGMRIEDLVLVTEDGHEILSAAPKSELLNPLN